MKIILDFSNCDLQEGNVRDLLRDAFYEFWEKRADSAAYVNRNYIGLSIDDREKKITQVERRAKTMLSIFEHAIETVEE